MNRTLACLVAVLSLTVFAQSPRHQRPTTPPPKVVEEQKEILHGRLDFTNGSNVKGQLNSSGAVSIVERKAIPMRSMISTPKDFRSEIFNAD